MKKKIFSLVLAIVFMFTVVSCQDNKTKKFKATFDANGGTINGEATYVEEFEEGKGITTFPTPKREGYTFLGWYLDSEKVTIISADTNKDVTLVAQYKEKVVFNYETPVTDSITLTADYKGKNFLEDGIGEVTVQQFVDGDTTIFKCGNQSITIRYQGIDTPESTYKVEPWGFAASKHTKETLKNAKTIVLQTDNGKPGKENVDTTGNRYLAWVWVDGRLLNLELVELGLANSKASATSLSAEFIEALGPVSQAKARIYGEKDPDYDYSKTYTEISLKELHLTYGTDEAILSSKDVGKKVKVSGIVTRMIGTNSAYIQQTADYDGNGVLETYGVYLYGGYNLNNKLAVGYSVIVSGTIGYYNGSLQISSVVENRTSVQSFNDLDNIQIPEVEDLKTYLSGKNLFLTGLISNGYLTTTTTHKDSVNLYVEKVEGGYYLYFLDGEYKKYIYLEYYYNSKEAKHSFEIKIGDAPTTAWQWNNDYYTLTCSITSTDETDTTVYYLGTYGDYKTITASNISYASNSFVGHFYPASDDDELKFDYVTNELEENKTYKFMVVQKNLIDEVHNLGNIIKVTTPLKITSYYDAKNDSSNATTLTAEYYDLDNKKQKVTIRIDNNITLLDSEGKRIDSGAYFMGKTFNSLICVLGYYDPSDNGAHDGNVQLMLTRMEDITYLVQE